MCMFIVMKNVNLTQHYSLFEQKKIFISKSKVSPLTEFSSAGDKADFDDKIFY